MAQTVTFAGNDLASISGLDIIATDPFRPPQRNLNAVELARADKSAVPSAFYKSRKIHVLANLSASSKANFESAIRSLQALLQGVEQLLVFSQAGVLTEYTATLSNIMVNNFAGGFGELDIEFFCSDPMGYAVSSTTLYNYSALVGSAYSFAVTWQGNVAQQPVITITVTSLLGGTDKSITIGNGTTLEAVTIERTWTGADILIVNCKTKQVTVNGTAVAYSGKIPEFSASQPITYADTLSNRNIAVNIVYQIRNL